MTSPVGNRPPSFNTAAKMGSSTGLKLGVNGQSSSEKVAEALSQLVDEKTAKGYASLADGLGSEFKGKLLHKVEEEMGKFINKNPAPSKEEIATEAKRLLMHQTVLYQTMKNSMAQMANEAINRMKDTFEG